MSDSRMSSFRSKTIVSLLITFILLAIFFLNKSNKSLEEKNTSIPPEKITNIEGEEASIEEIEEIKKLKNEVIKSPNKLTTVKKNTNSAYSNLSDEVKEILEEQGFTEDIFDQPLHDLCSQKYANVSDIKALLEKGYDINHRNQLNITPLATLLSSSENAADLLDFFQENGADFDFTYTNDSIQIYGVPWQEDIINAALNNPNLATKKLLMKRLEKRGYIITDEKMMSYMLTLIRPGNEFFAKKYISSKFFNEHPELIDIMLKERSKEALINYFIEKGTGLNFSNKIHRYMMYLASMHGSISIKTYKTLIQMGADVNYFDVTTAFRTPLMIASFFGNLDQVRVLLEFGADKEHINMNGKTALTDIADPDFVDVKTREKINNLLE